MENEEFDDLFEDLYEGGETITTDLKEQVNLAGELDNVGEDITPESVEVTTSGFLKKDPTLINNQQDKIENGDGEGEGTPILEDNDIISSILAEKGILDPTKIKYEDENGEIVEYSFFDLEKEEQISLLTFESDSPYSENELEIVNYLKENNLNFDELIEQVQRSAVEDYIRNSSLAGFGIDVISDEELFKLDLQSSYEDLTEEEINLQLQKELEHKDFFQKKMAKLRQEYLEAEDKMKEAEALQIQQEEEEKYNLLASELVDVAKGVDEIGGLDIDEDEKIDVLNFILDRDSNGASNFVKLLDDPDKLFKLAWYAVKGEEAFETLHNYYKKQIENSRVKTKVTTTPRKKTTVVVKNNDSKQNQEATKYKDVMTIDDLY